MFKHVAQGVFTFSLIAGVLTAFAEDITLTGSTTVQKRILEPTADAIEAATGVTITIRGTSSGDGFKDILSGKANASMSSSSLSSLLNQNKLENNGIYQEHVISRDVIMPIVHPHNPVSELNFKQLSDINTGKIKNWREVGGPNMKIVVVTSSKNSATRFVFQNQVMNKAPYVAGVRDVKSTRQEIDLVSKFKGGIGAISEGFVALNPGKIKVVKTNKISRPLSIITKGSPDASLQKVIDFLRTDKAKKHFK